MPQDASIRRRGGRRPGDFANATEEADCVRRSSPWPCVSSCAGEDFVSPAPTMPEPALQAVRWLRACVASHEPLLGPDVVQWCTSQPTLSWRKAGWKYERPVLGQAAHDDAFRHDPQPLRDCISTPLQQAAHALFADDCRPACSCPPSMHIDSRDKGMTICLDNTLWQYRGCSSSMNARHGGRQMSLDHVDRIDGTRDLD